MDEFETININMMKNFLNNLNIGDKVFETKFAGNVLGVVLSRFTDTYGNLQVVISYEGNLHISDGTGLVKY